MMDLKASNNLDNIKKKYSFSELPQSIIESDIFSYLNSKDLFYSVRGVCSEWQELMKNMWTENIKSEMIDQVKSLDFLYEKEIYTKTYEFKLNYLINYKQLLTIYSTQTNIISILKFYSNKLDDPNFRNFFKIFFSFVGLDFGYDCIVNYEDISNDENSKISIVKDLDYFLSRDEIFSNFRQKIFEFLDFETSLKDFETISHFKQLLSQINREYFENYEENAKLLFTFLQGLIEFQSLKSEVKDLRNKIETLIKRIKEETQVWPKRKNFFEKAYKLIIFSKSTNEGIRKMIDLFESQKIRHPIVDFNDQALQMIYDLKCKLTKFYDSEGCEDHFDENGSKNIEELIFNNILARRVLLTQKILIMDKFFQIYNETKTEDENVFKLENKVNANLKQLLWCLKFSSNSENENVSLESILKTKAYLDDHFDYENNIIYDCNKKRDNKLTEIQCIDPEIEADLSELDKDLELTFKQSEISLNLENKDESNIYKDSVKKNQRFTEEDLIKLRKEKEALEEQKSKTENVLEMLKKFVALKKNLTNNKKKYKLALYLLSKIRQGDTSVFNRIDDVDIDTIEFNEEIPISETEREELDNFKDSDKLMKEIEEGIMSQIENIMKKENDEAVIILKNEKNDY